MITYFACLLLFQVDDPEIPGFFAVVFSQELLGSVVAVIATSKVFRNMLGNIKGVLALILTLLISLAVGEFMFFQAQGWLLAGFYGLLAGLVSAGVFKGTKLFGKNVVKLDKS